MKNKQHTIKESVSFSGIGIHSGCSSTATCLPAEANHGIKFQRVDIENKPIIEALVDYVVDVTRSTTLGSNGCNIDTVEHLLAALSGLEIDNALIQVEGPEIPILDGSALPFIKDLQKVGVINQNVPRRFFQINEPIHYKGGKDSEISAFPFDGYKLAVMIGYQAEGLYSQHAYLHQIEDFVTEIAPNRTFCFFSELESLHEYNLIRGGTLDNALVIIDKNKITQKELDDLSKLFNKKRGTLKIKENILNNVTMHFPNEPARHKLLDLVGDLVLLGRPIKGYIVGHKPGHKINIDFVRKLRKCAVEQERMTVPSYDLNREAILNINHIKKLLPHRYPFQLVDKVIELDEKSITAVKNITINEPFFQGHFPNDPVMPGVLQIEAMVQTGGILVLHRMTDPHLYSTYFLSIENCRFKKKVLPGDSLIIHCELISDIKLGIVKMRGRAFVGNSMVCEATMVAKIAKKND